VSRYEHAKACLLYTAVRPGMHAREPLLNQLGEIARLAKMLVLRHVAQNEVERVALVHVAGAVLELNGLVLHLLDASRVFRFCFGEKVRLEAAGRAGILPRG